MRTCLKSLCFAFLLGALISVADVTHAQGPGVQPIFRAQMALANAEIYHGRIVCQLNRLTRWGDSTSRSRGTNESLRFEPSDRGTSMHYKLTSPERRVTIDAWQHELTITREQLDAGTVVVSARFEQRPAESLSLEVQQGDVTKRLTGDTVWQLWLADTPLCREHLAPSCKLLGIETPWTQFTQALEARLFHLADAGQAHDQTVWRLWLAELNDDRYAVREAADRQLRASGAALMPFLRRVDFSQLDAEQRYRLRRIMAGLQVEVTVDTVESTAEWLADDPRVWVELLNRDDLPRRETAARQVARLLESPIEFDAAANADVRHEQFVMLRERVDRAFDRH